MFRELLNDSYTHQTKLEETNEKLENELNLMNMKYLTDNFKILDLQFQNDVWMKEKLRLENLETELNDLKVSFELLNNSKLELEKNYSDLEIQLKDSRSQCIEQEELNLSIKTKNARFETELNIVREDLLKERNLSNELKSLKVVLDLLILS